MCDKLTNYSLPTSWAFLPKQTCHKIDVFYVYPTFYNGAAGRVMDIEKNVKLIPYIKNNVLKNTGIFGADINLFAPLYRQASFKTLSMSIQERQKVLEISVADILAAFDYYLRQYNNGRPFVLAGHSQGSRMLAELMKRKFSLPALMKKLISAYLIGYSVTSGDLLKYPWLKLAKNATDTGVIITYNTQSATLKNNFLLRPGSISVNPLNWGGSAAPKELNEGAVFFYPDGSSRKIENFTSAYIDEETGALIAPDADPDKYSSSLFAKGIYHIFDYEFFYRNLESNFQERQKNYFSSVF